MVLGEERNKSMEHCRESRNRPIPVGNLIYHNNGPAHSGGRAVLPITGDGAIGYLNIKIWFSPHIIPKHQFQVNCRSNYKK